MTHIIHKELSYAIRGVLFDVHNALGPLLPERFYQAAVAIGLETKGIQCEREKSFEVRYHGTQVGRYRVDIWVEGGKLLLELKVKPAITGLHRAQTLSYLKVTDADLGIVVNYGEARLKDERLPNYLRNKKVAFEWQPPVLDANWLYPQLTQRLFEILHRVHFELGPGFFHQVYRRATLVDLKEQDIAHRYIKELPLTYQGHKLGIQPVRLINVENRVLLATFAVKSISDEMELQLRARMKQFKLRLGLLANFNRTSLQVMPVRIR